MDAGRWEEERCQESACPGHVSRSHSRKRGEGKQSTSQEQLLQQSTHE